MTKIDIKKTCFFTGHRVLPISRLDMIRDFIEKCVIDKYNEGITDFISGGAKGFDTIAAQVVIDLKEKIEYKNMRLLLYIPCYNFGEKWKYADRCNLNMLRYKADEMEVITKEQYAPGCMKARNGRMVSDSCCGIAYMSTSYSGTGQTVAIAKKQGKNIINIAEIIKTDIPF